MPLFNSAPSSLRTAAGTTPISFRVASSCSATAAAVDCSMGTRFSSDRSSCSKGAFFRRHAESRTPTITRHLCGPSCTVWSDG